MRYAVVILAGGEGRRIGGRKPERWLLGRSLLDHALVQARQWSATVAISVRDAGQVAHGGLVPLLFDEDQAGPLAGVAAGLRFAQEQGLDAVLTIPCDTPLLPVDLGDRLASLSDCAVVIATSGGRLHPTCGLWRVSALQSLADYVQSGGTSLTGFARTIGMSIAEWPDEPSDPFFNVNDAADLVEAERQLRNR